MALGRSSLGRIDEGLSNWQYVVLASQIMHIIGISVEAQAVWGGGRLGLDFHKISIKF